MAGLAPGLNLFIDTSDGVLLQGQQNAQVISALTLPLFIGDTLTVYLWLFQRIPNSVNPANNFPFQTILNTGIAPVLYLTDGTVAGSANPLASCVVWNPDPTQSYAVGTLNLNTPGLIAALGTKTILSAYLLVGYLQNGVSTTVLNQKIVLGAGVPNGVPAVPEGLTPLSVQQARLMFMPIEPTAGQSLYLASPLGKVIEIACVDEGGTGGYHIDENPTGITVPTVAPG
jgi:hypothetical protein